MATLKENLGQLEKTLDEYFGKKAPQLPANIREIIVTFAPYLAILGVIVSLPAFLLLLGLGGLVTLFSPLGGMHAMAFVPLFWLGVLFLVPVVILEIMAIPGLFHRKAVAWKYMYWAELIVVVSNILQLNLVSAIIGGLIGFYLLFQVKSLYK